MPNSEVRPPAYLMGCHRSGTTLLRFLLDSHTDICCPPETKFLASFPELLRYPQALEGLRVSLDCSRTDYLRALRELVLGLYGKRLRQLNKTLLIDKTPNYFDLVPFLRELFPEGLRFIVLVRHPFDCALSLKGYFCDERTPGKLVYEDDREINAHVSRFGSELAGWCLYWLNVNRVILDSLAQDEMVLLRYEDLVRDPSANISKVLRFLNETDQSDEIVVRAFSSSHLAGGDFEDKKIRKTSGIHDASVGAWKKYRGAWRECPPEVAALAARLGYEVE